MLVSVLVLYQFLCLISVSVFLPFFSNNYSINFCTKLPIKRGRGRPDYFAKHDIAISVDQYTKGTVAYRPPGYFTLFGFAKGGILKSRRGIPIFYK